MYGRFSYFTCCVCVHWAGVQSCAILFEELTCERNTRMFRVSRNWKAAGVCSGQFSPAKEV